MMLPQDVLEACKRFIDGPVCRQAALGGGCIAHACRISTDDRCYFVKWSHDPDTARAFPVEAAGLRALQEAGSPLVVPQPIAAEAGEEDRPGLLLADWVEAGVQGDDFWTSFGQGLAALHRHAADRYGFDQDNFIGRLPQSNTWTSSWPDFFRQQRLEPQVARARASGRWQSAWNRPLERLYSRMEEILPHRPEASILHGDLWSGNFLVHASGRAALIDPAVYYGHREADLAMTELFGGFGRHFYSAYREAWPLEPGYEVRREVYNLYHLINHLNHFGGGYSGSVAAVLRRFS